MQYSVSLAQLLWHPQPFWGQGPDLILTGFVMYNYVDLPAGQNDTFDQRKKLKFGAEVTYLALDWFGVGGRFDAVQPNMDRQLGQLLGVLAAADLPHRVRDPRADPGPVLALLVRRHGGGGHVPVQHAGGRRQLQGADKNAFQVAAIIWF